MKIIKFAFYILLMKMKYAKCYWFKVLIVILSLNITSNNLFSQGRNISTEQYIELYKEDAIKEMNRYGIPASITLAQGIIESGSGNSDLAKNANNHFGIKCHDWKGRGYYVDDDEKNECFRKYNSVYESFTDHSEFLKNRPRYSTLFELDITDYKGWAYGLKKAGYATNPQYPQILINLIEKFKLYEYDKYYKKDYSPEINSKEIIASEDIKYINGIRCLVVKKGDTFFGIAKKNNMMIGQLYRYNELNKDAVLKQGQIIYLQPKRRKSRDTEYHLVAKGETLYLISQKYGIKLKYLCSKNNITVGTTIKEGDKLWLKKRKR